MKLRREQLINLAREKAQKSLDPSTKVGAVVETRRDYWCGWNQLPESAPDFIWEDRPLKYKFVIHAEVVALSAAGVDKAHGSTLYSTHHPCRDCAKFIAAMNVRKVVCPEGPWRDDPEVIASVEDAKMIFKTCGVETAYHTEGE